MAGRFAAFLRERGHRAAMIASRSLPTIRSSICFCYFGVMAAGATICTIHVEMNRNQLGNIFERLKPRLILYQDGLQLDDLLAARPRRSCGSAAGTIPSPARCSASWRV